MKAVDLQLGRIENKELTATIKANGALRVPNESRGKATPLFSGVIKKLNIQLGSHVKKGQTIATVSNPAFIQLQEEYVSLVSKITLAAQEEARQKALNEGQAGALKNLQNATANLNALRTRQSSLHQQLNLMGINASNLNNATMQSTLVITSPVSGTVSQVYAEIGSYVDPSSPVAEIVNNDALHLDLQIFEKDLPLIKIGQIIHFTLTNNPAKEYDAVVYSIGAAFENDSKTIPVHCRVNGDKTGMIDQMNITGIVSLSKAVTPAVPNSAIVSEGGNDFIFVAIDSPTPTKNKAFRKIQVISGVSELGYTAVTFVQALPKNVQIVTKGAFFVNATLTNV
ncbi:efflux RND transporter periplasmic adaptor subunit [Arachidicoccus terrestris]|nr:efflux RND transporter periplasmic adaptor subunit [Arachidicoccus terrestris]